MLPPPVPHPQRLYSLTCSPPRLRARGCYLPVIADRPSVGITFLFLSSFLEKRTPILYCSRLPIRLLPLLLRHRSPLPSRNPFSYASCFEAARSPTTQRWAPGPRSDIAHIPQQSPPYLRLGSAWPCLTAPVAFGPSLPPCIYGAPVSGLSITTDRTRRNALRPRAFLVLTCDTNRPLPKHRALVPCPPAVVLCIHYPLAPSSSRPVFPHLLP